MTEEELKAAALANLRAGFSQVLAGTVSTFTTGLVSPSDAHDALVELGAEAMGDMDTNGWQWDHWTTFQHEGKLLVLSGSGFYGNICLAPKES